MSYAGDGDNTRPWGPPPFPVETGCERVDWAYEGAEGHRVRRGR